MCYKWAVAAEADNRQPLAKNQLGIALLVIVLVLAVGAGLYFLLKSDKKQGGHGNTDRKYVPVSAIFLPANRMRTESLIIGEGFYWAGPLAGLKTEFRRTAKGEIYVRYVPKNARLGADCDCLVIATYPFNEAVNGLTEQANTVGADIQRGHGKSFIFVDPKQGRRVYMAFPGENAQIEIYGVTPGSALQLAKGPKIRLAS